MPKIDVELEPFRVPNYVMTKAKVGRKQDGLSERPKYHISEISDDVLHEMCMQFTKDVLAKKHRGNRVPELEERS